MNIEIRKIELGKVAELSKVAKQTFKATFDGTCTKDDMQSFLVQNYNEETLLTELQDENNKYYFATIDNEVVGYMLFAEGYKNYPAIERKKALELKRIYVLATYQGKGIAQTMMDFYINYAKENTYELAWLGVWEHNEKAKAFYAKYGFVNSGFTHDFPIGNTPQTDVWLFKYL
jgi:diamine N-acetyltransferase